MTVYLSDHPCNIYNTVAILPTVVGKIEYGLFYRRSTKLGFELSKNSEIKFTYK